MYIQCEESHHTNISTHSSVIPVFVQLYSLTDGLVIVTVLSLIIPSAPLTLPP